MWGLRGSFPVEIEADILPSGLVDQARIAGAGRPVSALMYKSRKNHEDPHYCPGSGHPDFRHPVRCRGASRSTRRRSVETKLRGHLQGVPAEPVVQDRRLVKTVRYQEKAAAVLGQQ